MKEWSPEWRSKPSNAGVRRKTKLVVKQTRPDIAFDTCQISVNMHKATIKELYTANKTINKVRSEKLVLKFTDIGDVKKTKIVAYSDVSFANLPEEKSQGSYIVFLVEENGNAVPLSWRSRKVTWVVKSTLSAETLALDESAIQSFYLKQVLAKIIDLYAGELPIIIYTDNHSLVESAYSTITVDDKCLLLDISSLTL